ncbi:MAG: leucine-rich repeat domain-containing protein, partial [Clostridia bacterium]|nr:leucine-rich repeat domain-containing protein [Clostridia bacterium]
MKQITAFFLAFAFLLGALPAFAVSAATAGYCGGEENKNGISWSFDSSTGTLTITGAGAMENWYHEMDLSIVADYGYNIEDYLPAGKDYVYTPWYSFRNDILHAVVSDGITTLGDFAFSGCTKLKDVTLGKDLTVIGHAAFEKCESLQGIAIPEKVKSIGVGAFYSNKSLTSVVIPEGVESLDYGAFSFCSYLTEISLPSTLNDINALCFAFCEKLASVAIPKDVQGIGAYTFYECKNMKTITFAGDLKYIN